MSIFNPTYYTNVGSGSRMVGSDVRVMIGAKTISPLVISTNRDFNSRALTNPPTFAITGQVITVTGLAATVASLSRGDRVSFSGLTAFPNGLFADVISTDTVASSAASHTFKIGNPSDAYGNTITLAGQTGAGAGVLFCWDKFVLIPHQTNAGFPSEFQKGEIIEKGDHDPSVVVSGGGSPQPLTREYTQRFKQMIRGTLNLGTAGQNAILDALSDISKLKDTHIAYRLLLGSNYASWSGSGLFTMDGYPADTTTDDLAAASFEITSQSIAARSAPLPT